MKINDCNHLKTDQTHSLNTVLPCRFFGCSLLVLLFVLVAAGPTWAQSGAGPINLFGYFQTGFEKYTSELSGENNRTSFLLQQANLFLQKDLAKNWTAFFSLEFLNNYSSGRRQGEFNLDEAWVRYRHSQKFSVKLGLQIPEFNHLNTIKNRTPLIPYIFRPLVYESALRETIFSVGESEYVPRQAFASIYGTLPAGAKKLDYAIYIGNSPNISNFEQNFQSGIDTSNTIMLGGRLGLRYGELKAGVSAAYDEWDIFRNFQVLVDSIDTDIGTLPRLRLGADLLFRYEKWSFESEYIRVIYDTDGSRLDFSKHFFYGNIGYDFSERYYGYINYGLMIEEPVGGIFPQPFNQPSIFEFIDNTDFKIHVPNAGLTFNPYDNLRFKSQIAHVRLRASDKTIFPGETFLVTAVSLSVYF